MEVENNPYMDCPFMIVDRVPDPGWPYLKQNYFGLIRLEPQECRMTPNGCYQLRWTLGHKVVYVQLDEIQRLYEIKTSLFMGLPIVSQFPTVGELARVLAGHVN